MSDGMNDEGTNWLDIGSANTIPPRGARQIFTPWGNIAVFRTGDDRYYALDDRCPHRQGPLSQGIVHGAAVTCPLHNWVIALDSGRAREPDNGCVRTYPVKLESGHLYIGFAPDREQAA